MKNLDEAIKSAQITADAMDRRVAVWVTVESEIRAGGIYFHGSGLNVPPWTPDSGPFQCVAIVFP